MVNSVFMKRRRLIIITIFLLTIAAIIATFFLSRQPAPEEVSEESKSEITAREVTLQDLTRNSEGFEKGREALMNFEEANPFVRYLPYESENFEVHYEVQGPEGMAIVYIVVLDIKADPANINQYNEEVNQLTEEVFKWIRSKGFDPNKLPIEWSTATDLYE